MPRNICFAARRFVDAATSAGSITDLEGRSAAQCGHPAQTIISAQCRNRKPLASFNHLVGAQSSDAGNSPRSLAALRLTTCTNRVAVPPGGGLRFQDGRPSVSNDYLNDECMRPWRALGLRYGVAAAATFPILDHGSAESSCCSIMVRQTQSISL